MILDRLQDPGNVGTVIRTAEAAGYSGVVTVTGCADVYSPKVVRAAAGSLFRVPVIDGGDQEMLIPELKKYGFKIAATSLDGDTLYRDADTVSYTHLDVYKRQTLLVSKDIDFNDVSEKMDSAKLNIIKVDDTVRSMGDLAKYYLSTLDVKKIAVTGSVGKTSVRDMIYYVPVSYTHL